MERPNDVRGFVHRRIIGAVGGFIKGGPLGAVAGFVTKGGGGGRNAASVIPGRCTPGFSLRNGVCTPDALGPVGLMPTGAGGGCPVGLVFDPGIGACVSPKSGVGARALADQFGEAVVGKYGAALVPGNRVTNVALCPRGSVLGNDGLCYNKRDISNKERMWPRGRRPLLTGGEMRAISTASKAAVKVQSKVKQLQDLGLLKKPMARKKKGVPPGHTATLQHAGA